jgi:hypothetical protein
MTNSGTLVKKLHELPRLWEHIEWQPGQPEMAVFRCSSRRALARRVCTGRARLERAGGGRPGPMSSGTPASARAVQGARAPRATWQAQPGRGQARPAMIVPFVRGVPKTRACASSAALAVASLLPTRPVRCGFERCAPVGTGRLSAETHGKRRLDPEGFTGRRSIALEETPTVDRQPPKSVGAAQARERGLPKRVHEFPGVGIFCARQSQASEDSDLPPLASRNSFSVRRCARVQTSGTSIATLTR